MPAFLPRVSRHVAGLLALVAAACGSGAERSGQASQPAQHVPATEAGAAPAPVVTTTTTPCRPAPLEARAAAVLVLGIGQATTADAPLAAGVAALGVGGVVLLGPNVVDPAQVTALIEGLRRAAPRHLLVSVDEEGGRVSRLRSIIGSTPSARTLGQRPLAEIGAVAADRATVLASLGFDLVLAPVADADGGPAGGAIGDRAFAATPAEAGQRAAAFVEGIRRTRVAATAKHFPGQGGLADSHDGTVVSNAPLSDLERMAAAAFRPVIGAGVPAVMMSHVTYSALGMRPASLEPAAYRLLRSMGFDGVAITDAVGMTAITSEWSLPEAAVQALVAGADIVLATPADRATAMRDAIAAAVTDGRLPEARLNEAVRRVVTLAGEHPSTMVCG
ncbi:MAG TPA: glycoside hydrolase family 3 N-terminal domain-containing protein [Acidimicrobiales bacterium]|nr:glycoside hydrolase family 3 N-terminal domain-containing protein [Acidimicrobiales bacterium]